eukprot:766664-Hanusia_phi.AAC.3
MPAPRNESLLLSTSTARLLGPGGENLVGEWERRRELVPGHRVLLEVPHLCRLAVPADCYCPPSFRPRPQTQAGSWYPKLLPRPEMTPSWEGSGDDNIVRSCAPDGAGRGPQLAGDGGGRGNGPWSCCCWILLVRGPGMRSEAATQTVDCRT